MTRRTSGGWNGRTELRLTRSVAKSKQNRQKKDGGSWGSGRVDHRVLVTKEYEDGGSRDMPSSGAVLGVQVADEQPERVDPLSFLRRLTPGTSMAERDEILGRLTALFREHGRCQGCELCDDMKVLRRDLLDQAAAESAATPWLPDPQKRAPGGAYSGKSQR